MRRTVYAGIVTAILFIAFPQSIRAVGETGAPALSMPISARSVAMGLTGVADASDPANVYYNPANVLALKGVYANGSFRKLMPGINNDVWFGSLNIGGGYSWPAVSRPFSLGGDITLAQLDYGESVVTDLQGHSLGTCHDKERYLALAVGGGVHFAERFNISAGVAIKRWWWRADYTPSPISSDPPPDACDATAFDIGTILSIDLQASDWRIRPAAAVAYVCEGDEIDVGDGWTDPLPTRINAGVSLRLEGPATLIGDTEVPVVSVVQNVDVTDWKNAGTTWGLGIEAAFLQIVFVRMGNFQEDNERFDEFTWGLGFGVPVGPVRAHLDYASRPPTWYWYPVADADQYGLSIVWSLP